jgi:hypothetical protein
MSSMVSLVCSQLESRILALLSGSGPMIPTALCFATCPAPAQQPGAASQVNLATGEGLNECFGALGELTW